MKLRIEHTTTLLLFVVILLAGCAQKGVQPPQQVEIQQGETQTPDVKGTPSETEKSKPVEKLTLSKEEGRDILFNSGHAHPDPSVDYTKIPEAPPGDTFFPTIQFPTTPPKRVGGHFIPKKNPYPVPEFAIENPDRFHIGERGGWGLKYTPELEERLDREVYRAGLKGDAFVKRYAEIVSEGLEPLPAAVAIFSAFLPGPAGKAKAKVLLEQALAEDPDNFWALHYLSFMIKSDRRAEAIAMRRRTVELRPDSVFALETLGELLIEDNYDNKADLREAIQYFEKAYRLNPEWHGPLLHLGQIYFSLKEYKKSLRYFQAVQVFRGGPGDMSSFYINLIQRGLANTTKQQGENK